ncbi:MAG: hypothetical protein GC153_04395 [Alphaproteobacteria bacterium]|nr:hypothetical protein [Alphaproteobacteria bacterium]
MARALAPDETLVWYEGSGTSDRRWLMTDPRGSVVAIADGTGAVTNINKYDEYGAPSIGAPTPIDPAISGASSIRARCG